jgi:hypothetical protein
MIKVWCLMGNCREDISHLIQHTKKLTKTGLIIDIKIYYAISNTVRIEHITADPFAGKNTLPPNSIHAKILWTRILKARRFIYIDTTTADM